MTVSASHTSFLQQKEHSSYGSVNDNTDTVELCKHLHEGGAVEEGKAIKKDNDPDDSRRDEQICVPAQPEVVQGHLLPKVVPDMKTHSRSK